jgi:transposase InsO family protein
MMDVDAAAAATPPMPHSPLPGTPDGIRLTRDCKAPRTIVVTPLCPPGMARPPGAEWCVFFFFFFGGERGISQICAPTFVPGDGRRRAVTLPKSHA